MMIPHQLNTLIKQRLQWMREHHYANKTVQSYEESLIFFEHWCEHQNMTRCNEISREVIETYQYWLTHQKTKQAKPFSIGYQRVLLSGVKQCFNWAFERGYLLNNPVEYMHLPHAERKLPSVLNLTQLQALLQAPDLNKPQGIRDKALLEVFYATALRRKEVVKLKPEDLDRKEGVLWVKMGKGKKSRKVPISDSAMEAIAVYELEVREEWLKKGKSQDLLFLSQQGTPLTVGSCNERINKYLRQVVPDKTGSCHLIRHSIATLLLEKGCHIRFIQELLGHSKIASTQIYAQVRVPHLQEAYERYHPSAKNTLPQEKMEEDK
jgi:integrase/recombinase XerD